MEGTTITRFLVIALVSSMLIEVTIASNIKVVTKMEDGSRTDKDYAQLVESVNMCLEQCGETDSKCPPKCLTDEVKKDKTWMDELVSDNINGAQALFCLIGCEASELCHDVNTLERAKHCYSTCHKYCNQKLK